ncbi:hypothetical protein ABB37_00695 [Leptomonas pyrrhocoris]|uniref:FPL domain-containing protein n=1 Tax=Leptomonas pyrrhocoris TaxID=157538 RepID=A0A0M9GB45_LEPPY|nr:hypothetical protein ABB37_00695 [Leptomonas pyrrhocoris]XP_015664998.1 hypothetical protein ABB37_00695 [Leptomonas pyrrhocoris]KPA86558.1 hypothetical protein ABB37_00695 [Leptomonas pyrrhocoris]KPA86559.1 hypothetical protein ABB37_00695 [Leptomonas pyrrhocoris]|eukprot:XP_015664997.1 hypothetical protein ABB37_00695 [Leptomonas pyrrhocoris]
MDKLKETLGIREKFSLENAQYLCDEVERIEELALGDEAGQRESKVLEASLQSIRSLTEVLVWMDRNKEDWFERVMERDVINILERLVTNGLMPSAIKLQSLQSITVMLQNLSRTSSIYYVCSNNHINRMVAVEFDMHDDEFVSLYVSFLKTLALRCTPDTVQFFFDLQDNAFPLWDRALRLLGSDDAMVRTAAKQIIVTIAQLQDSAVSGFVQHSIADVFLSVMRNVDQQLTQLAADIPAHASLQRFVHSAHTCNAHATAAAASGGGPQLSHSPSSPPLSLSAHPQQTQAPAVKTRVLTLRLEVIEDELLYLNDVCRTPVANAGSQAATVAQRLFLSRFQRIIVQETRAAAAASAYSPSAAPTGEKRPLTTSIAAFASSASDIPASVVLAFLLYWIQINTDLQVCAALMGFLVHPIEATPASAAPDVSTSIAGLVLQSARVDLHEAVTAIFGHALVQCAIAPSPAHVEAMRATVLPSPLRFPTSLSQFFYAETPYQLTGQVLVGGPNSTLPPPKEKFVQKAWIGGSGGGDANMRRPSSAAAPPEVLSVLIPNIFAALHTQLRYFHVTRLSCFSSTLSLLVKLLPVEERAERRVTCAKVLETAFLELMKLIQRVLLEGVKQYASAIQNIVRAQQNADGEVPLSRITFEDLQDTTGEEAPLPIRDPYAVMFLKLREAAQWLDADVPDRRAILSATHTKDDVYLFYPAYPTLDEETCDLVLNVWPPLQPLQHYHGQPQPFRHELANAYRDVQVSVTRAFPLSQRSPVAVSECELNLYVMFLLAKHFFESCALADYSSPHNESNPNVRKVDILRQTLRRLCPQRGPSHYFTLSPSAVSLSVRCELTSEWHGNANEASFAALGTPLCLVLPSALTGEGGRELLLLDARDNAPPQIRALELNSGECKRRVLLSLDLPFVGIALHPKYSFKVVISYQMAGRAMLLHVVLCDAATAKTVVLEVEKAANECRARGASFCFGIMNYRSALLD